MPDINPLGLWQPYEKKKIAFPSSSQTGTVQIYSSWGEWDNRLNARFRTTKIDYAALAGDPQDSSLVMAAVRWLGSTLPEAPLMVKDSPQKGDSVEVVNHPMVELLRKPNPFYSGTTLWKAFAFSWIVKGDVYFIKIRNSRGIPYQLWYVPHWMMRPCWPEHSTNDTFITHYEYKVDGFTQELKVEDVIHFRDGLDPLNPRCGLSFLHSVLRQIYSDNEAANYAARLMGGSGVPPFIISIDKELGVTPEDMRGIKDSVIRDTTGDHKGEPLVITGAKVEKLSFNPTEMDFRGTFYVNEERFCAATGIPGVVLELGSAQEHSIYNNVKQAMERAFESYLIPLYRHVEEELDLKLLPDFEQSPTRHTVHDLSKVRALQEDEDQKHTRVGLDYTNGIIMRGEARSALGYDPRPEDEVFAGDPATPEPIEQPVKSERKGLVKPSKEDEDAAVSWWEDVAPNGGKELIDAKETA